MKKAYLGSLFLLGAFCHAQVGIKTKDPKSTLDITATNSTGTSNNVDGLLVPRVDRERAQSMTGTPTSTMIFVNSIATGGQTGTTVNVDAVGYYYFNGSVWVKLDNPNNSSSSSVNIYNSDGTLTGNRIVTQGSNTLTFNSNAVNGFSVDSNTLSVDAANHRIGIGNTAPTNKLTVVDATNTNQYQGIASILANNLTQGVGIGWAGIQSIGTNANADLNINAKNAGDILLHTQSTGKVGVGTATPTEKMDIRGALAVNGKSNVDKTASGGMDYFTGQTRLLSWGPDGATNGIISFWNGLGGSSTSERMRIHSNGNVGIGTSTPQKLLHINGSMQLTNELNVGGNATTAGSAGTTGQVLTSGGAGAAPTWQTPSAASSVNIYNSDGTLTGNRIVTQGARTLAFTGSTANAFSVDGTTFSVDAANNRVGIGTAVPENRFHVVSAASVANRYTLIDAPAGTNQHVITALRNTSPAATGNYALLGFSNAGPTSGGAAWGIGSIRTASAEDFYLGNSTGGSYIERMRITSGGDVGIGISNPSDKLTVVDASNSNQYQGIVSILANNLTRGVGIGWDGIQAIGTSTNADLNLNAKNAGNLIMQTQSTGVGRVGIGTSTPTAKVEIVSDNIGSTGQNDLTFHGYGTSKNTSISLGSANGTVAAPSDLVNGDTIGGVYFSPRYAGSFVYFSAGIRSAFRGSTGPTGPEGLSDMVFRTSSKDRLTIDENGNVGIGTTNPTQKLHVLGNILASGTITPSDIRIKKDITDNTYGLKEIMGLRTIGYKYKDENLSKDHKIGFVAQEIKATMPELVSTADDKIKTLGVNYAEMTVVLAKAMQEQQKQIEELKLEITKLKAGKN